MKAPPDQRALLELLEAVSIKDARRAVAALERDGYEWTPLGGKEGNFGLVNIGSDPGFAFVERITNALDAVIDEAARHAPAALVAELDSPRAAVAALFDIPEGRVVHCSAEAQAELAGAVTVRIGDGSSVARPLLDVRDRGTGIAPDAMPAAILNLADSNKIAKPYLAGAYGRGGSTTFAFSPDGTVIASATADSQVGVTFVRFRELDARTGRKLDWPLPAPCLATFAQDTESVQKSTGNASHSCLNCLAHRGARRRQFPKRQRKNHP